MAYKICPNCGCGNNERANNCVNCGYYIGNIIVPQPPVQPKKKSNVRLYILSSILGFFVLFGLISSFVGGNGGDNEESEREKTSAENYQSEYLEEQKPTQEPTHIDYNNKELYNDGDYIITLVSGKDKTMNIKFENNSKYNVQFTMDALSVNGVTTDYSDLGCQVTCGKQTTQSYDLSGIDFMFSEYIEYANLTFWIADYDNLEVNFHTPVLEITTNMFDGYRDFSLTGDYVYENVCVNPVNITDDYAYYEIINDNDEPLYIDFYSYCINDCTMQDNYDGYGIYVFPHQSAYATINVSDDFKNLNNISSIDKVELKINIRKIDDYTYESTSGIFQVK